MTGRGGGGGVLGALFFVIGLLLLFCVLFSTFLIVPFFIFLAGIVAMVISDRKRDRDESAPKPESQEQAR